MKVPLPITTAISSMKWTLSDPSTPMYYEPIQSLKDLRQMKSIPIEIQPIISRGIHETIQDLSFSSAETETFSSHKHYWMLALGLILLGNGLVDEAHDLITPLSWSEDTYFGGPTMVPEVDESVVVVASYAHSLLHRREGYAQGEFGMIGYQNAIYWSNAALSRYDALLRKKFGSAADKCADNVLPFQKIRQEIIHLSEQHGPEAQAWCRERIYGERKEDEVFVGDHDCGGAVGGDVWDPRHLHELSAHVSKGQGISMDLLKFAESACEVELRLLLDCCLERTGCFFDDDDDDDDDDNNNGGQDDDKDVKYDDDLMKIDDTLAQRVANRISEAHMGAFDSSASVTIRGVLASPVDDNLPNAYLSAASGVACRLLGAPAVRLITHQDKDRDFKEVVCVFLPSQDSDTAMFPFGSGSSESKSSLFYGGGTLTTGDAFCFLVDEREREGFILPRHLNDLYRFEACDPCHENVLFVDRFYGSRGSTPTSVLQWSKGTIHKSF